MICVPHFRQQRRVIGILALLGSSWFAKVAAETKGSSAQFEVASLKLDDPNASQPATNLDLDATDYFRYEGGPVLADGYLINYIIFAYKLQNSGEYRGLDAQLPKWAQSNSHHSFRLAARAEGHPSKDALREMVRALLVERFGLQVHKAVQEQSAWVLSTIGEGRGRASQLRQHVGPPVCTTVAPNTAQPTTRSADGPSAYCGLLITHSGKDLHMTIRDYTMPQIAGELGAQGMRSAGLESLPTIDGTQLAGRYDLDLNYVRSAVTAAPDANVLDEGPTLLDALATQAGLEFRKKRVPVEVLIVDHVVEPTSD